MLRLEVPSLALLEAYTAALRTGWSPSNLRDVSGEHLAAIDRDPARFLAELAQGIGTIRLADGREVARLPGPVRWLWDGEFVGAISLRYVPGTVALPDYVSGHIGYAVVPWKRRRGYATAALAMILPMADAAGLPEVELTCDDDNRPSQRVIEANGGWIIGRRAEPDRPGHEQLIFRIRTVPQA